MSTFNWILNKSKSSNSIILLTKMTKLLHFVLGQKIDLQVIKINK